jgi:alanine dehydrogenase
MVLKIKLPKKLEREFRKDAMMIFGYQKGSLALAAQKALTDWVRSVELMEEAKKELKDPIESMDGLLKNINIDSVELQHLAKKLWTRKALKHVVD